MVQILDLRHPPTADDIQLWNWLRDRGLPAIAVLTKADKLNRSQWPLHVRQIVLVLGLPVEDGVLFSALIKCFNQTGAENMASQAGYSHTLVMFVAGDDAAKKPAVMQLARDAGFEAVDVGPLSAARFLEPYAMLWIHLAFKMGQGRSFGFAVVRR